jgi:DNA replication and repair protein RecF
MRLERLAIENFRLFDRAELMLEPGLSLFVGGNGAGKTSILEAVYLLAYGRSFRGAVKDGLIQRGSSALRVYAEVRDEGLRRLGLERGVRDWQARIDGQPVSGLSELYREIAVVCFEPGSHELIAGGSEHRRRYLDWALFHVEPAFLPNWRRYQRALKQRNMLLKSGAPDPASLDAWESELDDSGQRLTQQRERYLDRLLPVLAALGADFLGEAGALTLRFQRGWSREVSLGEALRSARPRDAILGHTTVGPHRADWSVAYEHLPTRETFSRGQEKLTALACVLAQAELFAADRGTWPILCLDDLASELDRPHLEGALARLGRTDAQILLTGTERPAALDLWPGGLVTFHVERGKLARLL